MSTDRELLELAAKAVGALDISNVQTGWDGFLCLWVLWHEGQSYQEWNPLQSDADALRLAIDLRIRIEYSGEQGDEGEGVWAEGTCFFVDSELCQGDRYKAGREAIVSVAAEIGRRMP